LKKELISARIATSLINWRHSGFSGCLGAYPRVL
jgi:hypothetical protein